MNYFVAALIGVIYGNFLTSVYSRSFTGEPIHGIGKTGIKPHCDNCRHELRFYEYLPVLSWIFCRFKCRYCGFKFGMQYFYIEAAGVLYSMMLFHIFKFTPIYSYIMIISYVTVALTFRYVIKIYINRKKRVNND